MLKYVVPICRVLKISIPKESAQYLLISANPLLRDRFGNVRSNGFVFDLKGNWDWGNRKASVDETVLKDVNFNAMFPSGVEVQKVLLNGVVSFPGDRQLFNSLINPLIVDTSVLEGLKLMDYSLLVNLVDLCPDQILISHTADNLQITYNGKPLRLGTFIKTSIVPTEHHAGQPIYKNKNHEYLYYWAPQKEWAIGFDYFDFRRGVSAVSDAVCPNAASEWYAYVGGGHKEGKIASGWSSEFDIRVQPVSKPDREWQLSKGVEPHKMCATNG